MENTVIKNAGFHHIALYASDFDRSMKFYVEGLGCHYVRGWGEGENHIAMLDFGNGALIELFAKGTKEEQENARFMHLAIATTDPDGAYEAALKAGRRVGGRPKACRPSLRRPPSRCDRLRKRSRRRNSGILPRQIKKPQPDSGKSPAFLYKRALFP